MDEQALSNTALEGVALFKRGKVRDVYDLHEHLLVVSTDRISCFDVVLPTGIPRKGEVLTRLSMFWFGLTKDIIPNHFVTADVRNYPEHIRRYADILTGRSMLVEKAQALPVECIVRGYLSGSGWKEYKKNNSVCGINLPAGMRESDKLPEPIFTPSTKEDSGHDVNVSQAFIENVIGKEITDKIKQASLALYKKASQYAAAKGIIIADTKFEFGVHNGNVILIDEILTPDSSRFWPKDEYAPGRAQPSFDKQFVRDYLETLSWDKTPPAPELPDEIVEKTKAKYLQAYNMLAGQHSPLGI
jgi:phosphoribosylaminoimidazole-succinocarboxamide synthase